MRICIKEFILSVITKHFFRYRGFFCQLCESIYTTDLDFGQRVDAAGQVYRVGRSGGKGLSPDLKGKTIGLLIGEKTAWPRYTRKVLSKTERGPLAVVAHQLQWAISAENT